MPIKDNTNAVLKESNRRIRQKLELAALFVERTAKEIVPVDTGTARRSITHEIAPGGKSARVGSNIEYFPYIEMGTPKMAAHAPLRRSLETNMRKIKKIFGAR